MISSGMGSAACIALPGLKLWIKIFQNLELMEV
jgi:hypothetical protein